MLIWVNLMACLKQQARRIQQVGRKNILKDISEICKDDIVRRELLKLKKERLPVQQKILLYCVIYRMSVVVMEIDYIRSKRRL